MFRFATPDDREGLFYLWNSCFGDGKDFVFPFLDSFMDSDNIYVCEKDGKIVSAVYALDCSIGKHKGVYFYAVATDENYRRQGLAEEEIRFLIDYKEKNGAEVFLLTPSNEKNRNYYSKLGFSDFFYCEKKEYLRLENKTSVTLTASTEKLLEARERIFGKDSFVSFPLNHLRFAVSFSDKVLAREENGKIISYAIITGKDIAEVCCEKEEEIFMSAVLDFLGREKAEVYVPAKGNKADGSCKIPRGMVYCSNKELRLKLSEETFLSLNLE